MSTRSSEGHTALLTPALSRLAPPQSVLRRFMPQLLALLAALLLTAGWACAQPAHALPQAPPPTFAPQARAQPDPALQSALTSQSALYSIGNPTDAEQLYLERINRARTNPLAEALRLQGTTDPDILSAYGYFDVDLNQFVQDLGMLPPSPPLAFHPALLQAARLHSQDMLANIFQGHSSSTGQNPGQRLTAQGYNWQTYGENVYAYAKSVDHGHAGFEVDWGYGPSGMQSPPGHRLNIHSGNFREIGVGVVVGVNGTVGPQLVTQDFGTRFGSTPLVTGVAYYDLNLNGFYDPGEGLGGVRVDVQGSTFHAITAASGGYAVPVPANGTYEMTFSASGLPTHEVTSTVASSANVKVDYVPAYQAPAISGPAAAAIGQENVYGFTLVGAATAYQWRQSRLEPYTALVNGENGLSGLTATVSDGYSVVDTAIKATGSAGFHLAHPEPVDQILELESLLRPTPAARLRFASRLTWATVTQVARMQVSEDDGASWSTLWSRAGTANSGQSDFESVEVSLSSFASRQIRLRFVYAFTGGSYYVGGGHSLGWYLDDLRIDDSEHVIAPVVATVTSPPELIFSPGQTGGYLLDVRAQAGDRWFPWGPGLQVSVVSVVPPVLEIQGFPEVVGDRVVFEVQKVSGQPGSLVVESAPAPHGPWMSDPSATFQTLVEEVCWRASAARGSQSMSFYRVRSQ